MAARRQIAVIDIDGVLADVRHRLHHVASSPKDWKAFFAAAPQDPPLAEGIDVARRLADVYEVVYLSGRPESCRRDTEAWFATYDLPPGELLLRDARDRRPARLMKVERLQALAEDADIMVLVDDDPQVCDAARSAGFDVLPADWMPEEPLLHRAQESDGRT